MCEVYRTDKFHTFWKHTLANSWARQLSVSSLGTACNTASKSRKTYEINLQPMHIDTDKQAHTLAQGRLKLASVVELLARSNGSRRRGLVIADATHPPRQHSKSRSSEPTQTYTSTHTT